MSNIERHTILFSDTVRSAFIKLDTLGIDAILFVVDDNRRLIGSLTDGDLRRGFIRGLGFDDSLLEFIQNNPGFVRKNSYDQEELETFKKRNFKIVPILDEQNVIVDILNFRT